MCVIKSFSLVVLAGIVLVGLTVSSAQAALLWERIGVSQGTGSNSFSFGRFGIGYANPLDGGIDITVSPTIGLDTLIPT